MSRLLLLFLILGFSLSLIILMIGEIAFMGVSEEETKIMMVMGNDGNVREA